jgi:Ca2+-binding RTX toxin-like protein
MDERGFRALCAGFCATIALFARATHAVPATPLVVDGYRCTIVGTPAAEVILGTPHRDVICGLGGADKIDGLGGDDVLIGGAGDDVLEGSGGHDVLLGDAGADQFQAWDGTSDRIDGGPGADRAWVDHTLDSVKRVEQFG